MIELSLRKNDEEVMKYFITKELTTVGRSSQNDICLPDPGISRVHVTILKQGDQYLVTDKSTNGTFVNEARISTQVLKLNDIIQMGDWTIHFGSNESEDERTIPLENREPTRVLSYQPAKGELILERAVLEITKGAPKKTFTLSKSIISIGKGTANDIVLTDDYISTSHCKIENREGIYYLKDLKSTNGTFLNGEPVLEAILKPSSKIKVGQVELRFFSAEEMQPIQPSSASEFEGIHSNNARMRKIFTLIERVAPSDTTVLIHGETGTGKELVARALHNQSSRANKPYVTVNCGAISRDLIESELFGHEKGAFTSAHQQRKGVFEQAHGGTLFLDEIGELPLDLQPKLLRVLETNEIKRVGGTQVIRVNVRVVAATHRNLAVEVKKGRFREDLYFRLFVVPIQLPPLRERHEDIPLLVQYFLKQEFASGRQTGVQQIDESAIDKLVDYPWPGNIRELKNVISRAVLDCQTATISTGDIQFTPLGLADDTAFEFDEKTQRVPQTVTRTLRDIEREKIIMELKKHNWNKKETAKTLGIAKSTLHEKIKKYEIQEE